jgi:hypothetical protein
VFLQEGWFDLLEDRAVDAATASAPRAALFRTGDLNLAAKAFADVWTEPPYRLERRWDRDLGLPPETFRLFSTRERIAPVGLAVIEHAYPRPDILPAWLGRANGALALAGLSFGGAVSGSAAGLCGARLDLSSFEYLDAETFEDRFGPSRRQVAVHIRVRSIGRARAAFDLRGMDYTQRDDALIVPPQGALGCVFSFRQ